MSIVDMLLRYEMLPLTLDIEHFAKMELLRRIERNGEDGYAIVSDFLTSYDHVFSDGTVVNRAKNEIEHGKSSPYISGLIESYPDFCFPAWAFLEIISFGTFIYFYKYCGERFCDKEMIDVFYLLQGVKSLRNACAHNNCILNELSAGKPMFAARYEVSNAVSKIDSIKKGQRKAKLKNDRIQQIATTLYVHKLLASRGVIEYRAESLHVLLARMNKHLEYYRGNTQIPSSFSFISSIVEAWYPLSDGLQPKMLLFTA